EEALKPVRKPSLKSKNVLVPAWWPLEAKTHYSFLKQCEKITTESSCHK
ncbi:hypothetical protein DBR06_SOUSAS4210026, partial [Sousa chinensis]